MKSTKVQKLEAFGRLLDIMDDLREKCPWDKKQTWQSLSQLTIEEVYELVDAISEKNTIEVKKELGDLFLHLVFYSKIASEDFGFDVKDVLDSICEKLIFRHPHVYGEDSNLISEEEVKANWEKLKMKEGNVSVLQGVPKSLPAMTKASRIQAKVKAVGFDWEDPSQVFLKVKEEIAEFEAALASKNKEQMSAELGDVFFSLINYARHLGIDPDEALRQTNQKFINRFQFIEHKAIQNNKLITEISIDTMNLYWNIAKQELG